MSSDIAEPCVVRVDQERIDVDPPMDEPPEQNAQVFDGTVPTIGGMGRPVSCPASRA
jgi:hypothetical protein